MTRDLSVLEHELGPNDEIKRWRAILASQTIPAWAADANRDQYGRWASIHIGKASIRLRWIPAGSFTKATRLLPSQATLRCLAR